MIEVIRVGNEDERLIDLIAQLDTYLGVVDGDDHAFYDQFNSVEDMDHCVIAICNGTPVGCGAIKRRDDRRMEIKRMFTLPTHRGKGIATLNLKELELWAGELDCKECVLETGKRQPEAIALYKRNGYRIIANFEPYVGVENSVCFLKTICTT